MKLTCIILTISFIQVYASAFSQKVTLAGNNLPIEKVFSAIKKQTGYVFFYNYSLLEKARPVTIDVKDATLDEALKICFNNQPLTFRIENKTIVVIATEGVPLKVRKNEANGKITGTVTDSAAHPLSRATVNWEGPAGEYGATATDSAGYFAINDLVSGKYKLTASFIGYKPATKTIKVDNNFFNLSFRLMALNSQLNEVIVSTGYQQVAKERATGSFEVVGKKLLNRSVSSNILDHLDGIVSGVIFDNRSSTSQTLPRPRQTFSIRGLSSINADQMPLIVVDNFPYKGDINDLNPNDVESVTVLKDAAAASIWGAQAGNGVVVITTKKGRYNQKTQVDFNSSVTVGSKPDLFSLRQISTRDYIDLEKSLFNKGYYDDYFINPIDHSFAETTPVVNLLQNVKNGIISQADADEQINAFAKQDARNDLLKYFYKPIINQQYNLSVSGGAANQKYYISGGYNKDKNANSSEVERYTLDARSTFTPLKGLELAIPIYFAKNNARSNYNFLNNNNIYPYAKLADANGNPLDINYDSGKNSSFNRQAILQGLYSYHYSPLSEFRLNQDQNSNQQEIRINPEISYSFLNGFRASVQYQYNYQHTKSNQEQSDSTYYVRSLINSYTQINADGSLTYPINKGSVLNFNDATQTTHNIRAQLNYSNDIFKDSHIDAIAGYEHSESTISTSQNGFYGYNPNTGQVQTNLDLITQFQQYGEPLGRTSTIGGIIAGVGSQFNVLQSKFANAAYTFKNRYIISGSGRIDQTNLFGANTNKRQNVLWSAGGSWNINQESFYHIEWLPSLKLRATYGFQGNIPTNSAVNVGNATSLTPLSIITFSDYSNDAGLNFATLKNVPNPNLTWEKVGQFNFGIDFSTKNDVITGSLEYYHKKGTRLIASYPVDPTTGVSSITGNIANITGNGIDILVNVKNIDDRFKWNTRYIFNHNTDKVTKYLVPPSLNDILSESSAASPYGVSPIEGNAIYGVYSLKSAGLDPETGDPRGYDINGNISKDYSDLVNNTPLQNLVYSGSANPTYFGSVMNNFSYKGIGLSINLTYQAGFYFHQQSVDYVLYGGNMLGALNYGADYSKRWQNPGDEKTTYVPSAPPVSNNDSYRTAFYQASSVLIQKGDNIRLQDIVLNYDFSPAVVKRLHLSYLQLYGNATLNTIIWRANRLGLDPQYPQLRPAKIFSMGLRASF